MAQAKLALREQQRLLRRGVKDIQHLFGRAFGGGLKKDFAALESANREFKAFVFDKIDAPEIRGYAAEIGSIDYDKSEPMFIFFAIFLPILNLFFGGPHRASSATIEDAKRVQFQYANLEALVEMMEED